MGNVHAPSLAQGVGVPVRADDSAGNRQVRIPLPQRSTFSARRRDESIAPPSGGYTSGMKTAVSLPDDVFDGAERHAKRTRKTRSQLYAEALAEYLARHAPEEVTDAMNTVVEQLGKSTSDPFVAAAARRVLKQVEW